MAKQSAIAFNSPIDMAGSENWKLLQQERSFFKFFGLIFSLHGLGLCSHHGWGYKGTFLLLRWRDPFFHLGSLAKVVSVHLILWLYMGNGHWWQIFFQVMTLCKNIFQENCTMWLKRDICSTTTKSPSDNQTDLKVCVTLWIFWCLISVKVESNYWPNPVNLLRNSETLKCLFQQCMEQSQVIIILVSDCIKTRIYKDCKSLSQLKNLLILF